MKTFFSFLFSLGVLFADIPTVAIITTGGTIAEKTDPKTGASIPASSGADMIESIPELKTLANYKIVDFSNIDSSQMTPQMWAHLSQVIDDTLNKPGIIGAVITHGTDTMAEASFFLELTIKTDKPVVLVGAMKNSSDPYSDGPPNLVNGVIQVCSSKDYNWGVTVTMNQYINSARNVVKTQTTNVQTFESGEKGYLGYIYNKKVYQFNNRLKKLKLPIPNELPRVDIVYDYAGSTGDFIRHAIDKKVDGIVVESVGAGNVNKDMYEAILEAIDHNIAVVITTRVPHGNVFPAYGDEGGGSSLQKAGAVVIGDLPSAKARLLLMLALPLVKNNEELYQYFRKI